MGDAFHERHAKRIEALNGLAGDALFAEMFELAQLAESENEIDATAEWHENVIHYAAQLNRLDFELKSFHELRRLYASGPQYDHLRESILWYFKWVAERLPEHVDIPAELIRTTLDQMEQFYTQHHESLRPVYALRARAEAFMGHLCQAGKYFDLWQTTPFGKSDDCEACELHGLVQYYLHADKPEDAINAAQPIVRGELQCEEVPAATFSRLLVPLLQKNEVELADGLQYAVVRQVRHSPKLISHMANHVVFLSLTGRAIEARRLAGLLLGRGILATNSYDQYASWRAGWIWLSFLAFDGIPRTRLPRAFAPENAGTPMDTLAAAQRCRGETIVLSEKFDARNGTPRFMESVRGLDQFMASISNPKGGN